MDNAPQPDWPGIIKIAIETDAKVAQCAKPGQRLRAAYDDSYRRARVIGYHGTEQDWQTFVRVRAGAARK